MQERDSSSNTHPHSNLQANSLVVDLTGEGNSGIEDNGAPVNTSGSQSLHDDIDPIEATSTTVQQSDTAIGERPGDDHNEAAENIVLAVSLLNEQLANISRPNLENTLYLFRQVLEETAPGHTLHSDVLRSLIFALGLKYICTKDQETLTELIHLGDRPEEIKSAIPDLNIVVEDDGLHGLQDTFELGRAAWDELVNATSLTTFKTIIFLLQQSLEEISSQDANRSTALATLAYAMYLQFCHLTSTSGLASLFTMLQDAESGAQEGPDGQMANIRKLIQVTISISGEHSGRPTREEGLFRELAVSRQAAHVNSGNTSEESSLMEYGTSLLKNFQTNGNMDDLENSIEMLRLGLTEMSVNNPNYSAGLNNFASGLGIRFENHGDLHDLNESISLHRQALDLRPSPHPLRSTSLSNMANGLSTRFNQRGNPQDLDESISLHRQALDLWPSPHPDRPMLLNNLAIGLSTRFEQRGNPQDLDESIALHRQALDLRPSPHPLRSNSLNNLAGGLNNLAGGLNRRFQQRGNPQDLEESISLHRQALDLWPSPHPDRPLSLNNLATGLSTRFEQRGNPQDLDESIALHRQTLDLMPSPHPLRSGSLNNLANGLSTRFKQRGNPQDLDESISLHRQALNLWPSPHPDRFMLLNNLASGLSIRFEQRGNPQDLDESISLHRQALDLMPSPHPDQSTSLNNLATGLSTRFEQRGNPQDLDESILLHRQALDLMPSPHPDRPLSLSNMANGLSTRFKQRGNPQDLDESISLHRQALDLRPFPHPDRPGSLINLANTLSWRFQQGGISEDPEPHFLQSGDASDLKDSTRFYTECIQLCPVNHPHRTPALGGFAGLYFALHRSDPLTTDHLIQAVKLISEAAKSVSASPSARYRYARAWAAQANTYHHPSALQAFDLAVSLMPRLIALGLDMKSRQDALTENADGLAGRAAKCAIRLGDLGKAIGYLETGRSVFWSQFLSLRSPLDKLADISPDLAEDLQLISRQLEKGSHRDQISGALSNREKLTLEAEANNYTKLAKDWDDKVGKVRQLEGFEDFLRPQRFSALQTAAGDGPIIYLVANDDTSDCLVITTTTIHHIPLPKLHSSALEFLVHLVKLAASNLLSSRSIIGAMMKKMTDDLPLMPTFRQLLNIDDRGMRPETGIPNHISPDEVFQAVLIILWDNAVKPVIDVLGLTKSNNPTKLTWCPTGLFTFLPVHAAGCYHESLGKVDFASEYFISSYTPTIEALLTPDRAPLESFQMMAVIQSKTLPSTREELKRIEERVSKSVLTKFGIPEAPATMESVTSHLSAASIVHFACHGKQDPVNPLQSGLEIEGERLTIARIMKESLPNGSLAFLSACETAMGDEKIPDEAMNIASSLLFTGFRKVVATMWRMWDEDGPVIADAFYRELFTGPDGSRTEVPDTSKSAKALWIAVKELHSKGVEFRRWVPFIHMGK